MVGRTGGAKPAWNQDIFSRLFFIFILHRILEYSELESSSWDNITTSALRCHIPVPGQLISRTAQLHMKQKNPKCWKAVRAPFLTH